MRRVRLGFAFDGWLVLCGIVEEDRRVTGADVGEGRVFLDPVEYVAAVVVKLLEL